jgi:transcriptional/translational regulatory protein YebC/TACO1
MWTSSCQQAVFTPQTDFDKDKVMEGAIESDMDDIDFLDNHEHHHHHEEDENAVVPDLIVAQPEQLSLLQDLMEKLSIGGTSHLMYLPKERVVTSEEDYDKNYALVESFEHLDDVDTVFHNMEL